MMGCLGLMQAEGANTLTPAEQKAGFKLLFDGASPSQWSLDWGIDDSAMHSPNTGAMIYSKEEFSNFEWKVDFKVNAGGNSGFFIRTKSDWYCDGFEVAVLDSKTGGDADARSNSANGDKLPAGIFNVNKGANFAAGSDAPIKRSGAIYDIYPTTLNGVPIPNGGVYVDLMKPAMEWNSMVIWANGKNIETWLNGVKVTDFVIGTKDWMDRYHRSKFGNNNNQCGDDFATLTSGTLVVQDHGAGLDVWIRNNKIRTFTPGSKLSGPLAAPNGGTFATATKVKLDAGITGAAIRYTLDGTDPSETSPLYNDSTGLMINGTATLKCRTFRALFTASDVTSIPYVISGTGVHGRPLRAVPEMTLSQEGNRLLIADRNAMPFTLDLVSVRGETVRSRRIDQAMNEVPLRGLKSGVYLVSMHEGEWLHTRKVAIP
jgi:hypothetical protein